MNRAVPVRNRLALATVMTVAFVAAAWPTWWIGLSAGAVAFGLVAVGVWDERRG